MKQLHMIVLFWFPALLWAGLIYYMSSIEAKDITTRIPDYVVHLAEYGMLAGLVYRGMINTFNIALKRSVVISILIPVVYGMVDEYHQTFVPGRTASLRDLVFDTIGAAIAVIVLWKLLPQMPTKLKNLAKRLHLL